MRRVLPFAAAMSLLASAAAAQTSAPAPGADPAPVATPAPAAAKPKGGGGTVSGLVVMPIPKKTCTPRDKDCIAMVVAELKRLYPEQLKQFCFAEQTKQVRTQFTNDQLLDSLRGNGPPTPTAFPVSSIVKTACADDKK